MRSGRKGFKSRFSRHPFLLSPFVTFVVSISPFFLLFSFHLFMTFFVSPGMRSRTSKTLSPTIRKLRIRPFLFLVLILSISHTQILLSLHLSVSLLLLIRNLTQISQITHLLRLIHKLPTMVHQIRRRRPLLLLIQITAF